MSNKNPPIEVLCDSIGRLAITHATVTDENVRAMLAEAMGLVLSQMKPPAVLVSVDPAQLDRRFW